MRSMFKELFSNIPFDCNIASKHSSFNVSVLYSMARNGRAKEYHSENCSQKSVRCFSVSSGNTSRSCILISSDNSPQYCSTFFKFPFCAYSKTLVTLVKKPLTSVLATFSDIMLNACSICVIPSSVLPSNRHEKARLDFTIAYTSEETCPLFSKQLARYEYNS